MIEPDTAADNVDEAPEHKGLGEAAGDGAAGNAFTVTVALPCVLHPQVLYALK